MNGEFSVVMVKPDAVQRGLVEEIEKRLNQHGLQVIKQKTIKANRKFILDLWPRVVDYEGRLEKSLTYLSETNLLIWLVTGLNALTETIKVKQGIREEYYTDDFYTLLHCPDTQQDFLREYTLFFPGELLIRGNDISCGRNHQTKNEETMKTNNQVEVFLFRKTPARGFLFLVLKRIPEKGGFWQPITGNVKEGETFEEAAVREIKEETGIAKIIKLIDTGYSFDFFDDNRRQHERVFAAEVEEDTPITLSCEHIEFKWVSKEEALVEYLKWPGNKEGLRRLCEMLEV